MFIEGKKILQYEGRYVKKHRAFFYQVLTPKYEPFHYYIKLEGKHAIALHMGLFNAKIDKAVRKAKKRLAAEYNISEAEIERIIEKKIEVNMPSFFILKWDSKSYFNLARSLEHRRVFISVIVSIKITPMT